MTDTLLSISAFFVLLAVSSAAYVAYVAARNNERLTEAYQFHLEQKMKDLDHELQTLPAKVNQRIESAVDDAVAAATAPYREIQNDDWTNVEPISREDAYNEWKYKSS